MAKRFEVVAEKEAEIVQALTNSVDSVRQIQAILRSKFASFP